MQRSWQFISLLLISIMTLTGCQSTYYSAMEKIGFEKRDILYSRVKDAKESQKDAQKEFESAYEEFSALINFDGGDLEKTNVNGGAIALGHPLGASGARLMTTLVHSLHARGQRYGLQTMCEGGGIANVTIIEAL